MEGKFNVMASELIKNERTMTTEELEDHLRQMSKREMQQLQSVLKTSVISSVSLRKKLVNDVAHAQAETIALRNQVGASAEFFTKALTAAEHRAAMLQGECDQCEEKLEDVQHAFSTLEQLQHEGGSRQQELDEKLHTLKEALYEHTRHFCRKELPILQAVSWQQEPEEDAFQEF